MSQDKPVPSEVRQIFLSGRSPEEIKDSLMNDTIMTLIFGESSVFFYKLYQDDQNVAMSQAINALVIIALTCVMISLGKSFLVSPISYEIN